MFLGEYEHTLDEKGRLTIPAKFRTPLGDRFVMTRGLEQSLVLYPLDEWEQLAEKLKALPFTRADARAFTRFFFSGAQEMELDRQGRVLIPPNLRTFAGIERSCVVIGVMNRVEVWETERWKAYMKEKDDTLVEIAEKLFDLDL
ncbi:MAG: division/cell wall cluster transcriptional repressor MraZ [Candidatus Carbobacillus altaicus]|nr:division/cell wall cluster transcriptional repressor MraZ [Candidatus Carbobacillus altaicus]